uniref:H15 domain-containing protein n=1 Tax=Timspurckia oligopyrenoides TaxID=708627 RepID=A0A7S1ET73_9RHOD|mmetsp:Transcript_5593/g.9843  ORF Transcript_5593/g.9843 Transcript_5593/m.9843 type:complete len:156 (+) Transcript_5593:82-549(+)
MGTTTEKASHPPYTSMVAKAIKEIGDRTGSSMPAITKFIGEHYKVEVNKVALSKAIKKGVEDGSLVRVKASYKLSPKAVAKASKPKKPTAAKKKKVAAEKKKTAKESGTTPASEKKIKKKSTTSTKKASTSAAAKPKKVIKKSSTTKSAAVSKKK